MCVCLCVCVGALFCVIAMPVQRLGARPAGNLQRWPKLLDVWLQRELAEQTVQLAETKLPLHALKQNFPSGPIASIRDEQFRNREDV